MWVIYVYVSCRCFCLRISFCRNRIRIRIRIRFKCEFISTKYYKSQRHTHTHRHTHSHSHTHTLARSLTSHTCFKPHGKRSFLGPKNLHKSIWMPESISEGSSTYTRPPQIPHSTPLSGLSRLGQRLWPRAEMKRNERMCHMQPYGIFAYHTKLLLLRVCACVMCSCV